jgi:hypothetical protein
MPPGHAKAAPVKPAAPATARVRTSGAAAKPAAPTVVMDAGPASATVSKHPLGHGQIAGYHVRIVTPVTTITMNEQDYGDPRYAVLCKVPGVECSAR